MALTKPIPKSVVAFDSYYSNMFYFDVPSGGNQVQKNRMIIKDNMTNRICYDETIISQKYEHEYIPSNAIYPLKNGSSYKVCFITYDMNNNYSSTVDSANYTLFYCYTKPTIEIANFTDKIYSSSYTFDILYNQIEGEKLKSYSVRLYDSNGHEISKRETINYDVTQWTFNDFENNRNYSIKIIGSTFNNTIVESELYEFYVRYANPSLYSMVELENNNDNGSVEIFSNLKIIDGKTDKPPIYIDNEKLDLTNGYLKWTEGFRIPKDFNMELWFELTNLGDLCTLSKVVDTFDVYNDVDNKFTYYEVELDRRLERVFGTYSEYDKYLTLSIERGIVNGEVKDYLLLKDGQGVLRVTSNKVDPLGAGSKIVVWLKKVGNNFELILDCIEKVDSSVDWNSNNSTIFYDLITNMAYLDERLTITDKYINDYNYNIDSDENFFPLSCVTLENGIYNQIDINKNIDDEYPHYEKFEFLLNEWNYVPSWNYNTILNCTFNGNIDGGNLDVTLNQIKQIYIKRREVGENDWIIIEKRDVNTIADLSIQYEDRLVPSNKEFDYAIVPIGSDGTEGDYNKERIKTCFNGVYVSDKEQTFKLYSGIAYADTTRNKLIGSVQPIGSKYPVLVENSDVDYLSGGVTGKLYGYNFEKNRYIDRYDVTTQTNDFNDFITNSKCKIVKDWNGNIWMCRVSQSPTNNYVQEYGNGITQVSFSWVEQGKWNNQEDLRENNLI